MLCEIEILVSISVRKLLSRRRIIHYGLAHLNWPNTDSLGVSASGMTYIVSGGALNSTHSPFDH